MKDTVGVWQCPWCMKLVSKGVGCNHMTCKCGKEFCFWCVKKYENRKKMCDCGLFNYDYLQVGDYDQTSEVFWRS